MQGKGLIRSHEAEFAFLYRISDLVLIVSSMMILLSYHQVLDLKDYLILSIVTSICFFLFAESARLYRSWRTSSFQEQVSIVILSWLVTVTLTVLVLYFSEVHTILDKDIVSAWILIVPTLLVAWRTLIKSGLSVARKKGLNMRRAIIVGQTPHGLSLAQELENHTEHGVKFEGFYDEREPARSRLSDKYPIKGKVSEALQKAKDGEVDYVYIAMPMHANERIAMFLNQFSDTTANTYLIPDFFTYNLFAFALGSNRPSSDPQCFRYSICGHLILGQAFRRHRSIINYPYAYLTGTTYCCNRCEVDVKRPSAVQATKIWS